MASSKTDLISDNTIEAAVMVTLAMSLSSELSDKENSPIGTYKTLLFDNLFKLNKEALLKYANIEVNEMYYSL